MAGHRGLWFSSEVFTTSHNAVVYFNDWLIWTCVLLSGNNYQKFVLLCKFLNLAVPSKSTFTRCQRLLYAPVILDACQLLLRLMLEIDITEIVTDASSSIIKRIKELQGKQKTEFIIN